MAEKTVLVIGGGISGITVASELAQVGIPTTLIEKEASLGGLAGSFCCKASESCNRCFACVVDKRCSETQDRQDVSIFTQTTVTHLEGAPGAHRVSLKKGKEKLSLDVSAIVVATGIDPYDASQKPEYGYGLYRNVITARDLDEMLRFRGTVSRPSTGQPPTSIAFFQCVGSRDESIGNLYCSQVCCAYALRLIKAIRHAHPEITATFLYMDIQPAGASFQQFLDSCRQDKGIRLIRESALQSLSFPGVGGREGEVHRPGEGRGCRRDVRPDRPFRGDGSEKGFQGACSEPGAHVYGGWFSCIPTPSYRPLCRRGLSRAERH